MDFSRSADRRCRSRPTAGALRTLDTSLPTGADDIPNDRSVEQRLRRADTARGRSLSR